MSGLVFLPSLHLRGNQAESGSVIAPDAFLHVGLHLHGLVSFHLVCLALTPQPAKSERSGSSGINAATATAARPHSALDFHGFPPLLGIQDIQGFLPSP